MKIEIRQLPEGQPVRLSESEKAEDLDAPGVKAVSPLEITADVIKIQDTLDIKVAVKLNILTQCSRCLEEREKAVKKDFRLDYSIGKEQKVIDISDDIRQEIILGYPLKPLCMPSCKGLCLKCGKNLNEGKHECE